jgi:hypothetical protein
MLYKINKNHVVNLNDKSDIGNTQGILQDIKPSIRDPKERVSRNITTFNRNKINTLYDKYNQIKNKLKDEKEAPTKKNEVSQFLDSLNNFNENYEKIKNKLNLNEGSERTLDNYNESSFMGKNNHYVPENTSSIAAPSNKKLENNPTKNILETNNNPLIKNKYNPINDLNVDDSLLNELTKFTKFALNEVNQSE